MITEVMHLKLLKERPGRPSTAGFSPERVVNVQINVESIDEELTVSRMKTNGLTEMLKGKC